jgi:4-hydroxy-3-polyprenylbenzoate decarboxylase
MPSKLVIAITGATGAIYGINLLKIIKKIPKIESHLIISKAAQITITKEIDLTLDEILALADHHYSYQNIGACLASGSFKFDAMIIAPCSVKSLAEIAQGFGNNLISRTADVALKERRKLVLMVRETPLNLVHIRNMMTVTEMGAIVAPPVNSFYTKPDKIEDLVSYTNIRILDLIGFSIPDNRRWEG